MSTATALVAAGRRRAVTDLATIRRADPLTGKVPAGTDFADEPIFREACAAQARVPWPVGTPFPYGVRVQTGAEVDGFVLTPAGTIEHVADAT